MPSDADDLSDLKAKKKHLEEFLARYRQIQQVSQIVQMNLDSTNWEIEALENRPSIVAEMPLPPDLTTQFKLGYNYSQAAFPLPPRYDLPLAANSIAVSTAGTTTTYAYVEQFGLLETPEAEAYSKKYTDIYSSIQQAQDRVKNVSKLIDKLGSPSTSEKFKRARNAYYAVKTGTGEQTSAAMEMRTLIDGVKGELFYKARKWPKEDMTWGTMAERLAKGGTGGTEHKTLLAQGSRHSSLICQLSNVGKDRIVGNPESLWVQVLDYLLIVLKLVQL